MPVPCACTESECDVVATSVTELFDGGVSRIVDQHLFGSRVGCDVVHERHAFVEEVPPPALNIAPHAIARDPLPFQACDEFAGNLVQVLHQESEGLTRRFLGRQHLDDAIADQEMVPVAVD
jgi:hypothetical protein